VVVPHSDNTAAVEVVNTGYSKDNMLMHHAFAAITVLGTDLFGGGGEG